MNPQVIAAGMQAMKLIVDTMGRYSAGEMDDDTAMREWQKAVSAVQDANRAWDQAKEQRQQQTTTQTAQTDTGDEDDSKNSRSSPARK